MDVPDAIRIIIKPKDTAPPTMVYREIVVTLTEPVPAHVAAAFGDGIIGDLDFGKHMRVDAVE